MEIVRKKVTKLQIIFTLLVFPHINAALECYSTATVNFKISLTISFFFFLHMNAALPISNGTLMRLCSIHHKTTFIVA